MKPSLSTWSSELLRRHFSGDTPVTQVGDAVRTPHRKALYNEFRRNAQESR